VTQRHPFHNWIQLEQPRLGTLVTYASDDFFAAKERVIDASAPVFIDDKYDDNGKWMDGWESRRKRMAGHDFCVLRICPGVIKGIEIDTSHFTGNFPPAASIEACRVEIDPDEQTQWTELVPEVDLKGDSQQFFPIDDLNTWSHIRLHIYPDGGIARFRVYGEPQQRQSASDREQWVDLGSADAGGKALECNNMHFGDMGNLLSTRAVANMGDGWETRRRRQPGNDWVILKLARKGRICRIEVDTAFFRGNYPARCSLKGASPADDIGLSKESAYWPDILPPAGLGPDQLHIFENQLVDIGDVTHVRLDIYPDGGVARLRLLGVPTSREEQA